MYRDYFSKNWIKSYRTVHCSGLGSVIKANRIAWQLTIIWPHRPDTRLVAGNFEHRILFDQPALILFGIRIHQHLNLARPTLYAMRQRYCVTIEQLRKLQTWFLIHLGQIRELLMLFMHGLLQAVHQFFCRQ